MWYAVCDFRSVAVYDSAVMEFWPLTLEQKIELFLIRCLGKTFVGRLVGFGAKLTKMANFDIILSSNIKYHFTVKNFFLSNQFRLENLKF